MSLTPAGLETAKPVGDDVVAEALKLAGFRALPGHIINGAEVIVDHAVFDGVVNDVAVPTIGVGETSTAGDGFPVDAVNHLGFAPGQHVWHCTDFNQAKTASALAGWLSDPSQPMT